MVFVISFEHFMTFRRTVRVDGGGPMKTNEGSGSIYLHVRHIALTS